MISQIETIKTLEAFTGEATLILINSVGFPVSHQIKVQKASLVIPSSKPSWWDKKCLVLKYFIKGKRKLIGTQFNNGDVAIGRGWQDIKIPESFECFDSGEFQGLLNQLKGVIYSQESEH